MNDNYILRRESDIEITVREAFDGFRNGSLDVALLTVWCGPPGKTTDHIPIRKDEILRLCSTAEAFEEWIRSKAAAHTESEPK